MLESPYKGQLESLSFLALCREIWLRRMLSCGSTLLWDRHSKGLPDMLRSSTWDFGFVSSSWWALWTQPAGTESNECLPHHWLSGGRGGPNSLCRTQPGKIPRNEKYNSRDCTSFQQGDGKGRPWVLPSSMRPEHGHDKKCSPPGSGPASSCWAFVLGHEIVSAGGNFFGPKKVLIYHSWGIC